MDREQHDIPQMITDTVAGREAVAKSNILQGLPCFLLNEVLSILDVHELLRIEEASRDLGFQVLKSRALLINLEMLIRRRPGLVVKPWVASQSQLKTLLMTLSMSAAGCQWDIVPSWMGYYLTDSADVASAVSVVRLLNGTILWPRRATCSAMVGENWWLTHATCVDLWMPAEAVKCLTDVWEGKQEANHYAEMSQRPKSLTVSTVDEAGRVRLDAHSTVQRIKVTNGGAITMYADVSIILCVQQTTTSHLLFFKLNANTYDHRFGGMTCAVDAHDDKRPPDLCFLSLAEEDHLCLSISGRDYLTEGGRKKSAHCQDHVECYAQSADEAPRMPEKIRQWLRQLTNLGGTAMRGVIAVQDPFR